MQEPSFWRDLRLEFQGLPDPVWSHQEAPGRLQASGPDIVGGTHRFVLNSGTWQLAVAWRWGSVVMTPYGRGLQPSGTISRRRGALGARSLSLSAGRVVQSRDGS